MPAQTPLGFIRSETDYDLIVFVVFEAIFPANVLLVHANIIVVSEHVIWTVLFLGFRESPEATDSYCGWMRFVALSVSPLRKNVPASQSIYIDPYYWTALHPKEIPHASSVWCLDTDSAV